MPCRAADPCDRMAAHALEQDQAGLHAYWNTLAVSWRKRLTELELAD